MWSIVIHHSIDNVPRDGGEEDDDDHCSDWDYDYETKLTIPCANRMGLGHLFLETLA